ncbi:hypothetical protein [Lactococcus petauri]
MAMKLRDYPVVKNSVEINQMIETIVENMYFQDSKQSDKFEEMRFDFEFERVATVSTDNFPKMMKQQADYARYYKDTIQMDNIIKIA